LKKYPTENLDRGRRAALAACGLRPSRGRACPLRLIGKRCLAGAPGGCACGREPLAGALVGRELYLDGAGRPALFVATPDGLGPAALQALASFCAWHGLNFYLSGAGWHGAGRGLAVFVEARR